MVWGLSPLLELEGYLPDLPQKKSGEKGFICKIFFNVFVNLNACRFFVNWLT